MYIQLNNRYMRDIMKRFNCLVIAACLAALVPGKAQVVNSDSWAATDALGRKVRSYDEAPARREGKTVGRGTTTGTSRPARLRTSLKSSGSILKP